MTKKKQPEPTETDSTYFLKLVMFVILGSFWLKFDQPLALTDTFQIVGLPLGLVIGLFFAAHDHFKIDRKIEYAVLLITAVVSLFLPTGIIL